MRVFLITFFHLLFFYQTTYAQQISRDVISSGGDFQTSNSLMISSTIGEPCIETFSGNNLILTQGFQQSKLNIVDIRDINQEITATVYPNPTMSSIILKVARAPNASSYELYSINGKLIAHSKITEDATEIKMAGLPSNIYLLRLFSANGKISQVIKIQKNN